jgi:hypothetical protein
LLEFIDVKIVVASRLTNRNRGSHW